MAITKINPKQFKDSTNPGSVIVSDGSNNFSILSPTLGADHLWFYDHSATAFVPLLIGTNLSVSGTTLNASAGAGGYSDVQEEGSGFTNSSTNTKLNFVGAGFTAADAGAGVTSITMDATLNALAAYNTNGILTQTGADTFTGRTITGTAARISITNGNGVSGNPTIDIDSGYVGQTSITTLGTIATGTWSATTIAANKGGTGQTSYAIGDLLSANTTSTLSKIAAVGSGSVLKSAGVSTLPVWGTLASTELSDTAGIMYLAGTQTVSGTKTFSNNITLNATPSAGTDVTNVTFVNTAIGNAIAGIRKGSVRAATTVAGTLASSFENGDTVDGVTLATGDLILIKNQAAPAENGVYTVNVSGAPTRATWMDTAAEIDGVYVAVEDGTANVGTLWITVSEVTTLNTDAIAFTQIQTSGNVTGTGVANKVAYWDSTTNITQTTNFHFNGTQLAIGTATPVTSTIVTTQGTGTGSTTYGFTHNNSSAAKVFSVSDDGTIHTGTTSARMAIDHDSISNSFENITIGAIQTVTMQSGGSSQTGSSFVVDASRTITSGSSIGTSLIGTFNPTSGTATNTQLSVTEVINQTGGANGITRGIHILPTITAAADYRGLEITTTSTQYALWVTGGKVRIDLPSSSSGDTFYRAAGGEIARLSAVATSGHVLTSNGSGAAPSWQAVAAATVVTRAYLTGSTSSVIDLDSGTAVTDVDGANVAFTVPADLNKTFVVRNGVVLSRSGTVSRDYTLVSATGVLTLAYALTADESLMVYKID